MSIINTFGKIKYTPEITLCDTQDDGTVKHIIKELNYKSYYEFMVYNPHDHMLYTIKGKLKSFGSDPLHYQEEVSYLIIDTSKVNKSELARIIVSDIKSIKEIKDLE